MPDELKPLSILSKLRDLQMNAGELPLQSYEEHEQEAVDRINQTPGDLKYYDCPDCMNRGYIYKRVDGYTVAVECGCMIKRRCNRKLEKTGLKEIIAEYSLRKFETKHQWQSDARSKAIAFLNDNYGKWFCALGAVGSGKSHICTGIVGELLKRGMNIEYMKWRDESVKLKACVNDAEEYSRLISPIKHAEVLYIDDFWKTESGKLPTTGDINLAFEILNHRYINKNLITLISSELILTRLLEIDEAVGSRIYQRSRDYCVEFIGKDKNYRLQTQ